MNSDRFNPDMLRLARDRREATQAELAKMAGVTQALVSKLEHGLIGPSDDVLEKLSVALRFPPSFFFQNERAIGFPHFHYRKRARLGAKQLASIGAMINIRRQHISKLARSYEKEPAKPIPQIDLDDAGLTPEKVAERLRGYWMLPRGPVADLTGIIEDAGGIVIQLRFGTSLLDGLSFRSEGLPPIFFLNRDVPGERYRFSLAHELGHMVMHTAPDDDEKMEIEAHRFAAAFLMPAQDVRPYLGNVKFSQFSRIKPFWQVSIKALIKRAHTLKLITDNQYRSMSIDYNKYFREGEPCPIQIEPASRFREMISFHLDELRYSTADLASLLCVQEEDVRRSYIERPRIELVVSN